MKKFPTFSDVVAKTQGRVRVKHCVECALKHFVDGGTAKMLRNGFRLFVFSTISNETIVEVSGVATHVKEIHIHWRMAMEEVERLKIMAMQKNLETK